MTGRHRADPSPSVARAFLAADCRPVDDAWATYGDPASGDWTGHPPAPRRPSWRDRLVGALINAMSRRTR